MSDSYRPTRRGLLQHILETIKSGDEADFDVFLAFVQSFPLNTGGIEAALNQFHALLDAPPGTAQPLAATATQTRIRELIAELCSLVDDDE